MTFSLEELGNMQEKNCHGTRGFRGGGGEYSTSLIHYRKKIDTGFEVKY